MTLQQLKDGARKELKDKYNFEKIFGVNSIAEQSLQDFIDHLITKAYREGKNEILNGQLGM